MERFTRHNHDRKAASLGILRPTTVDALKRVREQIRELRRSGHLTEAEILASYAGRFIPYRDQDCDAWMVDDDLERIAARPNVLEIEHLQYLIRLTGRPSEGGTWTDEALIYGNDVLEFIPISDIRYSTSELGRLGAFRRGIRIVRWLEDSE